MGVLQVPITFVVFVYLLASMKILNEHERGIILRLGRLIAHPKGPGLILVFRPIDRMFRVKAADLVRGQPITLMDGLKVRLNGDTLELA